ncbi:transmembrane protein 168-like [Acropora palmata]|uniref:transmembrane protein 168-like n=1 Tax=Acropora palmata TaxID=6131 RepID=UPI003DA15FBE
MLPQVSARIVQYSAFLSYFLFLVGSVNGIRERWIHHTADGSIHFLALLLSLAVLISIVTYIYGYKEFAKGFYHLWMGVLYSVLSFTEIAFDHPVDSLHDLDSTDILIIASAVVHCFKALIVRLCCKPNYESVFLTCEEFLFLLGFLSGSAVTMHFGNMLTICFAVIAHLVAFHMKSSIVMLSAVVFCIFGSIYFFPANDITYDPFILLAFIVHLAFESLIDIYFCRLSLIETWKTFILRGKYTHRLQLLVILVFEILFYGFCMQVIQNPHLPVYRLPVFLLLSIPWVWFHFMFLVTCWGFLGKLEECCIVLNTRGEFTDNFMSEIMASKGIRHFSLVSQIVTLYTLFSTFLITASAWQPTNAVFIAMLFIILPIELLVWEMLKLGKSVGGTAIGYAVVAPAHKYSPFGSVIVLPENAFHSVNTKGMELITIVSRFFSNHMIHNFGTDFLTSGISTDYLKKKINSFFEQRIHPGLNYDTYILYYSGHVTDNGNWALTEDNTLSFEAILNQWRDKNSSGARLILVLDTAHSDKWVDDVWKVEKNFIAIQAVRAMTIYDPEQGNMFPLGELTKLLWDDTRTSDVSQDYFNHSSKVKPVYGVSKEWCCFKFHEPTVEDICLHVEQNFPRFINKPITKVFTYLPCNTNVPGVFDWLSRGCRRIRMRWFPPAVYDTGHGFQLIAEFK